MKAGQLSKGSAADVQGIIDGVHPVLRPVLQTGADQGRQKGDPWNDRRADAEFVCELGQREWAEGIELRDSQHALPP